MLASAKRLEDPAGARRRAFRPATRALLVFLGYLAASAVLFGTPVAGRLSGAFLGGIDARIYAWSLSWWPHALAHGLDPFTANVVWVPQGIDLAWVTSVPGPSLAAAPLTLAFGPIVTSNLIAVSAPALAGWSAYLLANRVTAAFWPSVAGGSLFGFSSYMVAQLHGHMNLYLVFCVPLAAYVVVRGVQGSLSPGAFVALMSAALLGQLSISTEVFLSGTVVLWLALVVALAAGTDAERRAVARAMAGVAVAYGVTAVLASPYLVHLVAGWSSFPPDRSLTRNSADLLGFVVPGRTVLVGGNVLRGVSGRFSSTIGEDGAYLGVPLLAVLALVGLRSRRHRVVRLLLVGAGLAAVASLGPSLQVAGTSTIPLPWALVARVPLLRLALPIRLTLYLWLSVALIAALWLASPAHPPTRPRRRWALVALGAALLVPNVFSQPARPSARVPAFIADGTYRTFVSPGQTVLVIAPKAQSPWQASAGFGFRTVQGYTGIEPPAFRDDPVWLAVREGHPDRLDAGQLRDFLARHCADAVLVDEAEAGPWEGLLSGLGVGPVRANGVLVYRLPEAVGRAC